MVARVDEIQVLVNLKFIKAIVSFGLESIKPLREATDGIEEGDDDKKGRDSGLHHQVSRPPSTPDKGGRRESGMSMSVNINHPLVALLEDAHQMNTAALVCQVSSHTHTHTHTHLYTVQYNVSQGEVLPTVLLY